MKSTTSRNEGTNEAVIIADGADLSPAEHRMRLTRAIFETWLRKFTIPHEIDGHGMMAVRVPRNRTGAHVPWDVAFAKDVADDRGTELITYTNPRFQAILREIGEGPAITFRKVRRLKNDQEPLSSGEPELLRTDVSFHVSYRTYGDSREELVRFRVGPEEFEDCIVTDLFRPDRIRPPVELAQHIKAAETRLIDVVEERTKEFCRIAIKRMGLEEAMLDNHSDAYTKTKSDQEDHAFFQENIDRHRDSLSSKYAVEIHVRLLTVEPYLADG